MHKIKLENRVFFLSSSTLLLLPPGPIFFSSSLSPSSSAPEDFLFSSISIFLIYDLSVLDWSFLLLLLCPFFIEVVSGLALSFLRGCSLRYCGRQSGLSLNFLCGEKLSTRLGLKQREGDILFPVLHRFSQPQRQVRQLTIQFFLAFFRPEKSIFILKINKISQSQVFLALWVYSHSLGIPSGGLSYL